MTGLRNYIIIALAVAAGFHIVSTAYGEENSDQFILPETAPSIERWATPDLDRPMLKKQNFIPSSSVEPSQFRADPGFGAVPEREYPAEISMWRGGFSSTGGRLSVVSRAGWKLDYVTAHSGGETPRFASDDTKAGCHWESYAGGTGIEASFDARENTFSGQVKNYYLIRSKVLFFPWEELHVSAGFLAERGEIKGMDQNEQAEADFSLRWQPSFGHDIALGAAHSKDSGFSRYEGFTHADLMYRFLWKDMLVAGAGASLDNERVYPDAGIHFYPLAGMRFEIVFSPGIDKPDWNGLYAPGTYVASERGLLRPENILFMSEKWSYYIDESFDCGVEFFQKNARNTILWETVSGTEFMKPYNHDGEYYQAGMRASAAYKTAFLRPRIELSKAVLRTPLAPLLSAEAELECLFGAWTVGAGYAYAGERSYSADESKLLAAYGDASLSLRRSFAGGINIFVNAKNVLGQEIEKQPYFKTKAVYTDAGLTFAW